MTTPTSSDLVPTTHRPREHNRLAGGAVLIILGVGLWIGPLTNWHFSWLALPVLAVIFLTSGLIIRSLGLLIPGGILAGIALGTMMIDRAAGSIETVSNGGIFLLCFAAGWVLISVLSPFTDKGFRWWPLVPAAILAAVGAALVSGQIATLAWLSYLGPVALIGLGVWLIFRKRA